MTLQSIKRIIDITMDEDGKYNVNPAGKTIFAYLIDSDFFVFEKIKICCHYTYDIHDWNLKSN